MCPHPVHTKSSPSCAVCSWRQSSPACGVVPLRELVAVVVVFSPTGVPQTVQRYVVPSRRTDWACWQGLHHKVLAVKSSNPGGCGGGIDELNEINELMSVSALAA